MKKMTVFFVLVLVFGFVLTGCDNGTSSDSGLTFPELYQNTTWTGYGTKFEFGTKTMTLTYNYDGSGYGETYAETYTVMSRDNPEDGYIEIWFERSVEGGGSTGSWMYFKVDGTGFFLTQPRPSAEAISDYTRQ
jgi:hypothetical protein